MGEEFWVKSRLTYYLLFKVCLKGFSTSILMNVASFDQIIAEISQFLFFRRKLG